MIRLGAGLVVAVLAAGPTPSAGQEGPEEVARAFFDALGRLRWERVSERLHPEVLADFRMVARQLVDSRRGDSILIRLYGSSRADFDGWSEAETFRRTMSGMVRYARGLMESQVATDVRILGTVPEGDSVRHVVYREATDHMGTLTGGVSTVSLVLHQGRWRVRENAELEVLQTALRGIPIGRGPPSPFLWGPPLFPGPGDGVPSVLLYDTIDGWATGKEGE